MNQRRKRKSSQLNSNVSIKAVTSYLNTFIQKPNAKKEIRKTSDNSEDIYKQI